MITPSIEAPDGRMLSPGVWLYSLVTVDDYRIEREGSRWRVTCEATAERLNTVATLGLGISLAQWHAKGRPAPTERPEVTREELAAFIGSMEPADFPVTYVDQLLEHFEIRRKP